ncbi:coiled-coil domain-containing protein [Breznakia pachnodae]|uniref:Peptidoglycan hydrolase CwlO-like protein n=1 Tax=Breznakia pachnodae TaxID=265178 RepID=A0ABU0E380_9FIRM|nr:CHAP domain-containing protein [Breznakia pachnodae]MDQ0361342.1 peptidoglycan hydrolase CwlO-like protein [Breznakia pachnodae]
MKKMKRFSIVAVALVLMLTAVLYKGSEVEANDFEGNESYWTDVCSQYITDASLKQTCNEYKSYLQNKANEKLDEASKVQSQVDEVEGDLAALGELAYSYKDQIAQVESEISAKEASIAELDASIAAVNEEIRVQEEKIAQRKESIKSRMVDLQYSMNSNEYINYIMGAEDLVDFIQRSESIGTFTEYDNTKMDELNDEIAVLADQREEQQRMQETQEAEKAVLEQEKERVSAMNDENEKLLATLETKKTELAGQQAAASDAASAYSSLMPSEAVYIPPSVGQEGGGNAGNAANSGEINFYSDWYKSPYNIISNVNLTGQCTWFVHGRVGEKSNGAYRNSIPTGNANTWYAAAGLPKGSEPRSNSLIVWGNGSYGHVAYVESYDSATGTIRITEGNVNAPNGGLGYGTSLATAIAYTNDMTLPYSSLTSSRGAPIGFIYL